MTGHLQALVALAAALAVHLGAFALTGEGSEAASPAAGDAGEATMTLQAADGSLAALVESWTRPPEVESLAPASAQPLPADEPRPELPATSPAPRSMATATAPPLPTADPMPAAAPSLPDAPRPEPEPEPAKAVEKAKPPAKPNAPSESRKAEKAMGTGGGEVAGTGNPGASGGLSKTQTANLKKQWGASISKRVERRKAYPSSAGGATGTVTLRLTVARSGALQAVTVLKSSGHAALDAAAVKAAKSAGRFPAAPKGLDDTSYAFQLPLRFAK